MSELEKDLYKLIGNYEATCKQIFDRLGNIDESLDEGTSTFRELREKQANHNNRLQEIEKHGVPRNTRLKIDGGLILGIINGAITLVKAWFGA